MADKPLSFKDFLTVDYTQTGDGQLAKNAKKRKTDDVTGNTGEGVISKFKKALTQKKKDAEYNKKNTAYKKRSDARTNRSTELDLNVGDRVAKGDRTSLKNPSRIAHNKRALDKSTSRYKHGHNLPRLPEEVEQQDEALSHAQRIKASLRMKKMKARIKIGRDRAMRKAPNMDVVKKRAMKKARTLLLKKMTKGVGKDEMSFARRA
jgi:hypothetical protein